MTEKCAAKEGATQAEVDLTLEKKPPTTYPGKCIQACLAETAGMLDGLKLNVEKTIQLAGMAFDFDETVIAATRLMADKCRDVTGMLQNFVNYFLDFLKKSHLLLGPDRCEAIFSIFECAQRVAKENNLPETIVA